MKILLCLLLLITSHLAWAFPGTVAGFVVQNQGQDFFLASAIASPLPLKATRLETQASLDKLSNQDYFQGQGEIVNGEMLLDSIDFVGLRRLLGVWTGDNSVLNFQDYSQVTIYHSFLSIASRKTSLQYSIAPTSGSDWRIFFTNSDAVLAGSLTLGAQTAELKVYDMNTGSIVKTVELTRFAPQN